MKTAALDRTCLQQALPPFGSPLTGYARDAISAYRRFYQLAPDTVDHTCGTFSHQGYTLAGHLFVPRTCASTVLLMHGYLDHTGLMSAALRHLLENGHAVAVYDLPGHGLSTGAPSAIDSFGTYAAIMRHFIGIIAQRINVPLHVVAHSTGCATVIEDLSRTGGAGLEHLVLVAPLVRSCGWHATRGACALVRRIIPSVPRVFRQSSSDPAFVAFNRADPLQQWQVSLSWVQALIDWNTRITNIPPSNKRLLVLQGTRDTVVDWKYNMRFLSGKFPAASIRYFPGGKHQLLNEAPEIRAPVFAAIDAWLANPAS
jgi:alpha-beta hydrolase superfamily lysophospholipase